jgi:apolipoprotein D and lipocalin family protein
MKVTRLLSSLLTVALITGLFACASIPKSAKAVSPFEKERYLGLWYEIARKDFKFERNLNNTTAEYSLNEDCSIRVKNQGYNTVKKEWTQAIGKAKFVGDENKAQLKVSFFGPFYSGYNVIALDEEYCYALVAGKNLDLLWILSREKTIPVDIKDKYIQIAKEIGYDTSDLIWEDHD